MGGRNSLKMRKCTTPVTELSAKGEGQTLFVWIEHTRHWIWNCLLCFQSLHVYCSSWF